MLDVEQAIQLIMQKFGVSHDVARSAYVGNGPNGQPIFNPGPLQAAGANIGGAGGGGSVGDELKRLLDEANAANESRYGEIKDINAQSKNDQLAGLDSGYGALLGTLDAGTAEARERSGMRADEDESNLKADLSRRGLLNTTMLNRDRENIRDRESLREREITADNAQRQIGVRGHYIDSRVGTIRGSDLDRERIIEDRTDSGPNLALYAQLLSQPGAGGGGGFSGGYAGGGSYGGHHAASGFGNITSMRPSFERPSVGANPFRPTAGGGGRPISPYVGDVQQTRPARPDISRPIMRRRPTSPYAA